MIHPLSSNSRYAPVKADENDAAARNSCSCIKIRLIEIMNKVQAVFMVYAFIVILTCPVSAGICGMLYLIGDNSCNYGAVLMVTSHNLSAHQPHPNDPFCDFRVSWTDHRSNAHQTVVKEPCRLAHESAVFVGELQLDACYNWKRPNKPYFDQNIDFDSMLTEGDVKRCWMGLIVSSALFGSALLVMLLLYDIEACMDLSSCQSEKRDDVEMGTRQ